MNTIAHDDIADAIGAWLLDAPPIAQPCPDPITMTVVLIRDKGTWPTALIDRSPHHIVGATAYGWLSIVGAGWRQFRGGAEDFERIAAACNAAQIVAFANRTLFDCALRRHAKRPETGPVGGLECLKTEDGRRWVRIDDITYFAVKTAFERHLADEGSESMLRIRCNLGAYKIDETYACADAWWLFARKRQEPSLTT